MPQVVQPWLIPGPVVSHDTCGNTQIGKRSPDSIIPKGSTVAINEETLLSVAQGMDRQPPFCVISYRPVQVAPKRHQPRLVEFRVANRQHCRCCIDIGQLQLAGFTSAQACSVEQQQQRSESPRFKKEFVLPIPLRRIEQTTKFILTVNIGNDGWRLLRDYRRHWQPVGITSADRVPVEAEQGRMLSMPVTGEGAIPAKKRCYLLFTDVCDLRFVSSRTAKGGQQSLRRSKIGAGRSSECYVQRDDCPEFHLRPPSVKSATWRSETTSTLA
jgi:hypothetical protein